MKKTNFLKKYSFFCIKNSVIVLVYDSEYVGEFEEENIAIILLYEIKTRGLYLSVIDHDDKDFKRIIENKDIRSLNKISLRYLRMRWFLHKRRPNYSSVLMSVGRQEGSI